MTFLRILSGVNNYLNSGLGYPEGLISAARGVPGVLGGGLEQGGESNSRMAIIIRRELELIHKGKLQSGMRIKGAHSCSVAARYRFLEQERVPCRGRSFHMPSHDVFSFVGTGWG
jgi:hypothetical protein